VSGGGCGSQTRGPSSRHGLLLAALSVVLVAPVHPVAAAPKPNVIYILADDLGYGDLGCFGQKQIKTPNLDRMAKEGLTFTQHYAGSTVCAPSRAALMTGKHVGHLKIRGNTDVLLSPKEMTLARLMKNAGYATACIGKWGIGHPPPLDDPALAGFDYFYGYLSMWHAHNHFPDFLFENGQRVDLRNGVMHPATHYKANQEGLVGLATNQVDFAPTLFTEQGLAFIDRQSGPFFLYMAYNTPHANNEAPDFGHHGMDVPDLGEYAKKKWPDAEKGKAAMITMLDADVGRFLEKLKQKGIAENTLVIFTSDNGPHKEGGVDPEFFHSSGPFRGIKRDLYEGGIRMPTLAWWPGTIQPRRTTDHISAFWDLMPTLAELSGQPVPDDTDGISFLPTLLGRGMQAQHDSLYWEFHESSSKQAVRKGKWKAVRTAPSKPIELYDLEKDRGEKKNVAARHPDVVAEMQELMSRARREDPMWPLLDAAPTMSF
jgi:arylsulfatase A-like enzyme